MSQFCLINIVASSQEMWAQRFRMTSPDPDPEAMHADAALYAFKRVRRGQHKFFKDQKPDLTIQ
jgi:hypothetical protein|tara:strand:- start:247 stop:438 length:192 start_codon:yes stop_codon:yes gene_type:complete